MRYPLLLLLILFVPAVSCVSRPDQQPHDSLVPPQLIFADPDLRERIALGRITFDRDLTTHLLRVHVPLRPAMDMPLDIDWRVTWFDANGIPLGHPGAWTSTALPPGSFRDVTADSWTARAADARIELRWAK